MKSEILIVNSIKDGAGLSLSALSIAQVKIKELESSSLSNKTALINAINSALNTIKTKDANNQIDYSNQDATEIVTFNNAIGAASTALEGDKKTKIANLQTSHATLSGKVTEAEGKISGLESFKQTQEAANTGVQASLLGLNSELAVIKKKALDNAKEYFQGNYIPTKASEPASLWNTLDKCLEHEGDIYTVKVDAQSPQSAHDKNMFQYMFYRTTKGDPTSVADFDWMEMGSGQYSALSASVATLDQKVMDHDSDAHFKEKITANKDKIVSEVKTPIAEQAKQDIVSDNAFVRSVTPKIDPATGKWKNADGTVSDNYALADKVPAFTQAVSGANSAASAANTAASGANQVKADILQAKNNGEFSAVRLYVEQTGSFKNGKVVDGVSGKVILVPKYFVGGVEKNIVGSGKVVKWYKVVAGGTDTLKKSVTATGTTDVRLLLGNGEMGTYYFDLAL